MQNRIVGFFDEMSQAEEARTKLLGIGIMTNDIQSISGTMASSDAYDSNAYSSSSSPSTVSSTPRKEDMSFGQRIKNFFTPMGWDESSDSSRDLDYYAEGVRHGGVTLTVTADESKLDEACRILNDCGAVDIDRRSQYFKESGFSGYDFNAAPLSQDESLQFRNKYSEWEKNRFSGNAEEQSIPVVEERVDIGKRMVQKGRVRVFTHVTETPIEKELHLRDEKVQVERTPVDRPIQASDMDAFKEGEIEMRETSEEAVVNKEARVVEEVRLRKESQDRTETIRETARRTDVEVDRSNDSLTDEGLSTSAPPKGRGKRSLKDDALNRP